MHAEHSVGKRRDPLSTTLPSHSTEAPILVKECAAIPTTPLPPPAVVVSLLRQWFTGLWEIPKIEEWGSFTVEYAEAPSASSPSQMLFPRTPKEDDRIPLTVVSR